MVNLFDIFGYAKSDIIEILIFAIMVGNLEIVKLLILKGGITNII
jgi:hypothetical protein